MGRSWKSNTNGIEQAFQDYLRKLAEDSYAKLINAAAPFAGAVSLAVVGTAEVYTSEKTLSLRVSKRKHLKQ